MNTRVEPLRAGLAIVTAMALAFAMMMVFGSAPALGQQGNPPSVECAGASGFNNEWWKVQINTNGTAGTVETSTNVDNNDIAFSFDSSTGTWTYTWTNQSDDGYAVVRVVEKSGQTADDVHNGLWLVGEGFSNQPVASDISHITFCFAAPPTTVPPTTAPPTTVPTTAPPTTVAPTTTTTTVQVLGTVITTSTTAPAVQATTTVPTEVLDTQVEAEELPFTGIDSELLIGMGVLMLMSGLLVLGVTGKREDA